MEMFEEEHESIKCKLSAKERKDIVFEKKLCFYCLSQKHLAGKCEFRKNICKFCGKGHHPSLCGTMRLEEKVLGEKDEKYKKGNNYFEEVNLIKRKDSEAEASFVMHFISPLKIEATFLSKDLVKLGSYSFKRVFKWQNLREWSKFKYFSSFGKLRNWSHKIMKGQSKNKEKDLRMIEDGWPSIRFGKEFKFLTLGDGHDRGHGRGPIGRLTDDVEPNAMCQCQPCHWNKCHHSRT